MSNNIDDTGEYYTQNSSEQKRKATLFEALITFTLLVAVMGVSIVVYEVDPHVPMFVGVIFAALMALKIGYSWTEIEESMIAGINQALQSVMILAVIGILVGVWILSGVVPSMIYYGLMILKPSIFLVATVLICSITSIATGSSWGTAGTMGIALMGVSQGMGIPPEITAGAILSGAYFGDKISPLSDTTNLAPSMAGTDVFSHIKAMLKSSLLTYFLTLAFFAYITLQYQGIEADTSAISDLQNGLQATFTISPLLLLPPVIVIGSIAFKMPAIPGITLGIIVAAAMAPIFQGSNLGALLTSAKSGYVANTGIKTLDSLLTAGGLESMLESISLTIIAMMFGGIMEMTGQLEVIVKSVLQFVHGAVALTFTTLATGFLSNVLMPEQYISIVVPGRMFANEYKERGYDARFLSANLEASGTVTSVLVPWNTCGVYMSSVLKVSTMAYLPYAVFNYLMPIVTLALVAMKQNIYYLPEEEMEEIKVDSEVIVEA